MERRRDGCVTTFPATLTSADRAAPVFVDVVRVAVAGPLPHAGDAAIHVGNPVMVHAQPAVVWIDTLKLSPGAADGKDAGAAV